MVQVFYDNEIEVFVPYTIPSNVETVTVNLIVNDGGTTVTKSHDMECSAWHCYDWVYQTMTNGNYSIDLSDNMFDFIVRGDVSLSLVSIVYKNGSGTAVYTKSFSPNIPIYAVNEDYKYELLDEYVVSSYSPSGQGIPSGQSRTLTFASDQTPVGMIKASFYPFEGEGKSTYFEVGTSRSVTLDSVVISYNGNKSVTFRNNKPDQGGDEAIDVTIYGHGENVKVIALENKSSYPAIPATLERDTTYYITSLDETFKNKTNLTQTPDFSEFEGMRSVSMARTFAGCTSLKSVTNNRLLSATDLTGCFQGCTSLEVAPDIPLPVQYMSYCFDGCTNLSGNINMYSDSVEEVDYVFRNTTKHIYILNPRGLQSIATKWINIASGKSNIHFETVDNSNPLISGLNITRVGANGSTQYLYRGTWAYIVANITIYRNYLPEGYTNNYDSKTFTVDGITDSTTQWTFSWDTVTDPRYLTGTMYTWVNVGDTSAHDFSLQISDTQGKQSVVVNYSLPKAYCLVDYYHDPNSPTREGIAFGKFAEHPDLVDIEMDMTVKGEMDFGDAPITSDLIFKNAPVYYGICSTKNGAHMVQAPDFETMSYGDVFVVRFTIAKTDYSEVTLKFNSGSTWYDVYYYPEMELFDGRWEAGDILIFKRQQGANGLILLEDNYDTKTKIIHSLLRLGWDDCL